MKQVKRADSASLPTCLPGRRAGASLKRRGCTQRLRAAAEEWSRGHRPQVFLSRVSEVVKAHAVGEEGRGSRVVVVNRIGLPMVGRGMAG